MDNKHRFTPLLIAIGTIAGIFIGSFYTKHFSGGRINIINTGTSKVGYLLQLIDNNYVDTVIQLPDNLFFGTTIATCIMVLKKNKVDTSILFIDASKEFVKVGDNVKIGDVLCIIESMKLMNEIKSEFEGKVSKILLKDGDAVEYGQSLIVLE